jgi:2-keto-4-pentenoate hydratase/2-oxohepta-3-ene-1,7-dioic acid hydratase in catechol pathway
MCFKKKKKMGVSIIRFQTSDSKTPQYGVLKNRKITPIEGKYTSLGDFIKRGSKKAFALKDAEGTLDMDTVTLFAPVTRPCRILCQGMNYAAHRVEAGTAKTQKENLYFRKDDSSIANPFDNLAIPEGAMLFDYEVEMGIVVGKDITADTKITAANVGNYVAGVVLCNETSIRDIMFKQPFGQWFKGKSMRASSPFSAIYLFENKEEADLMNHLLIKLWLNDDLRQNGQTANLISKPHDSLSEISQWCDMMTGDVLLTGTPGGVCFRMPPEFPKTIDEFIAAQQATGIVWPKKGDVIKAELVSEDGSIQLGFLENKII